ncbi:MAG: GIY-YIG nuclease family protein [Candidatus Omnitrophota bacterium]
MPKSKSPTPTAWYLYILKCKNKSLYTGITNNLKRRLKAHKSGKGAWYTRVFGAGKILYTEELPTKRDAFIRERTVKRLTRQQKLALIKGNL